MEEIGLMSEGIVFIDGDYVAPEEAKLSVFDTGLIHSDIVYDTVSVWAKSFFKLEEHLDRFERSCAGFRLANPFGRDEVRRILAECVVRSGLDNAMVRMHVCRGAYPEGVRDPRACQNRFFAHAVPYLWIWGKEKCRNGANLHISSIERISAKAVDSRFKNFHWGDFVQSQFEAYEAACDDPVLCGPDGSLTEGPGYNIFVAKDGRVATPERNCLEGITRQTAIELCEMEGVPLEVRDVAPQELEGADEAFATSTAGGIIPVTAVDGTPLGNGAPGIVTSQLVKAYWTKRAEGWCATTPAEILAH
jgi:branched-chain amino acid aminotransferase